jgi:hypothetical protein
LADKKKILVICFSFPPFRGIGGRRWAKFAKYLVKKDHELFVISARNDNSEISEWIEDVKDKNIHTYEIPLGFSKVLSAGKLSFKEKIIYKFLWGSLPFLVKGNPQDKLYFVKDKFLSKAKELISKEKIDTVIVSIPPYKLAYYMLELKKQFPSIKFVTDYRDPWTDNKSYHGFAELDSYRLKVEEQYEAKVLEQSDLVLNVHLENLEALKLKIKNDSKFVHILNGFDKDDYSGLKPSSRNNSGIRFIYSGSFYPNLIYLFQPFLNGLKKLKEVSPGIYTNLQFDFYGNMDHKAKEVLLKSGVDVVKFHGAISKTQVLNEISASDYSMMFTAPDYAFGFNTKFYDYLYLRKPIIYFGHAGKVSEYLLKNNIGEEFIPEKLEEKWFNYLSGLNKKAKSYNTELDISEFELTHLTDKLIRSLNA